MSRHQPITIGPHAWELTRASGRDGAELLHHGDAVELRPDVGHATVLEAVEVHALDPDRLARGGDPHELLLQRTGHDPPGGDGIAAGDDVLQVLPDVGEARLEARDLLLEAGQRRLFVGRWIVVDQARVAELVDRRLVGRAKRVLEARDDLDVVGQGQPLSFRWCWHAPWSRGPCQGICRICSLLAALAAILAMREAPSVM